MSGLIPREFVALRRAPWLLLVPLAFAFANRWWLVTSYSTRADVQVELIGLREYEAMLGEVWPPPDTYAGIAGVALGSLGTLDAGFRQPSWGIPSLVLVPVAAVVLVLFAGSIVRWVGRESCGEIGFARWVSTLGLVLLVSGFALTYLGPWTDVAGEEEPHRGIFAYQSIAWNLAAVPVITLVEGALLTGALVALTGRRRPTVRGAASGAFRSFYALFWLNMVVVGLPAVCAAALWQRAWAGRDPGLWLADEAAATVVGMAALPVPLAIVAGGCGFWHGWRRAYAFVRRNLMPYLGLLALGGAALAGTAAMKLWTTTEPVWRQGLVGPFVSGAVALLASAFAVVFYLAVFRLYLDGRSTAEAGQPAEPAAPGAGVEP